MKKFFASVAMFVLLAILTITMVGCGSRSAKMKEGNIDKATSMQVGEDGKFRVLQFTDTHLIGNGKTKRDQQTLRWMSDAVTLYKPDLVELTGDITGSGTKGRDAGILAIANMFEEMKQPWAYSFGNHDGEWSKVDYDGKKHSKDKWIGKEGKATSVKEVCSTIDFDAKKYNGDLIFGDNTKGNQEIFNLLGGYEYCLSRQSAEELKNPTAMGVGNYVIDLKNASGKTIYALIHMDTHGKMYFNPAGNTDPSKFSDVGYVGLTDAQIDWYKVQAKKYANLYGEGQGVKTAVFMHIPHFGFRESTENMTEISEYGVPQFEEKPNLAELIKPHLFENTTFVKQEGIYSSRWEDNLESAIDEFKTTNFIAVGHDHNNSFSLKKDIGKKYLGDGEDENNIVISYGRCSGVNAWGRRINIGATIIDIDTTKTDLEGMYDVEVVYPTFSYIQKHKGENINVTEPHLN